MNADLVSGVLHGVGARGIRMSGRGVVSCSCLLAPWTHSTGRDEHPSMAVFPSQTSGEPVYKCLSCQKRGLLRDLLLTLWHKGHDTFHWIEVLDGDRDTAAAKPLKPAERRIAEAERAEAENFVPPPATEDRPTYDFRLVSQAEAELPELPWPSYEKYLVDLPQKYVESRGLSAETCATWQLGNDRRQKRLMFPVRDRKGRLVAISGRLYATRCLQCDGQWVRLCVECGLTEKDHGDGVAHAFTPSAMKCVRCGEKKPPPYKHSYGFKRNLTLYGEHMDDPGRRLFVVEGHIDMLKLWQAGYRPVVATLGASPGGTQVEKIVSRWGDRHVVVVPDGDHAGEMMGKEIVRMVRGRMPVSVTKMPDGFDPGGMTEAQMRDLLGDP